MNDLTQLPTIYITYETKRKLDYYIMLTNNEISGFGHVVPYRQGLLITDVFIVKQECSSSESDMSQEAIADMLLEMVLCDIDTSTIKLWFHSHAKMKTFWSKTDTDTIAILAKDSWLLSIVGSHIDTYLTRLDIDSPIHLTLDNLDLEVITPFNAELRDSIKDEIASKVTVIKYEFKKDKEQKNNGKQSGYVTRQISETTGYYLTD